MRYSQWRAFDAVAREGSFTRAAARLRITQPAVTLQVKALEALFGAALFMRIGRKVALTEAGQLLFEMTGRMFAIEGEMRAFLAAATSFGGDTLRISADGPHVALQLVSDFRRLHPRVQLTVKFGNATAVWQDIVNGTVSAAVVANPPRDRSISTLTLATQHMVALLPVHHRLSGRKSISLEALHAEPLLLRESGSNTRRILDLALRRIGLRPAYTLELGSREAIREAVAIGLGVGFVFDREATTDPRTVPVRLDGVDLTSRDMLVFRRANKDTAMIEALIRAASLKLIET